MKEANMDPLEIKISAALHNGSDPGSNDLANLLTETEQAIVQAEDDAAIAKEVALDPIRSPDLTKARQAAEDAAFRIGRLKTLLPRLRKRYQMVVAQEQADEARARAEPLRAERDALAQKFAETYADYAKTLAELFQRMSENAQAIARFHASLPDDLVSSLYLRDAECEARKLAGFNRDNPSVLKQTVLPNLDGTLIWPPQRTPQPIMSAPPPYNPRFSPEWGRELEQQTARAEAEEEAAIRQSADEARQRQRESGAPVWWEGEKR
jgi:hypothetical protein